MAYGIGSILGDIDQKADAYRNNPDALAQSYQQNQQLIDLLVLQKLKTDKEAAQRDMQAKMQTPASTIKNQREEQVMGMTRNEVAQQVTPGLQALGQQMQAAQAQPQAQGISSVPAPNMQQIGMKGGGIIAFQEGAPVKGRRIESIERMLSMDPNDISLEGLAIRDEFLKNVSPEERYAISMNNPNRALTEEQLALEFAQKMGLTPSEQSNQPTATIGTPTVTLPPPAEDGMSITTVTPTTTVPTQAAPTKGVTTGLSDVEKARLTKNVGLSSLFAKPEDTTKDVLNIPADIINDAPLNVQDAYAGQLDDLENEKRSKLGFLASVLKGFAGKATLAGGLQGASDSMNERRIGIQAEINNLNKEIETISVKRSELDIARDRNTNEQEANRLQAAANRNRDASQERMKAADIASAENIAQLNRDINNKSLDNEARVAAAREVEANTNKLLAETAATQYIDDKVINNFKASLVGLTASQAMLTELIAANVGSEAALKQYQAQYNEYAKLIDEINRRLTGIPINSVPTPSTGTPDTDAATQADLDKYK